MTECRVNQAAISIIVHTAVYGASSSQNVIRHVGVLESVGGRRINVVVRVNCQEKPDERVEAALFAVRQSAWFNSPLLYVD